MTETLRVELANCESVLLTEVADEQFEREDVAKTYALTLRSSDRARVDWAKVNAAIVARWSLSGLTWIKTRAWKLAEGRG